MEGTEKFHASNHQYISFEITGRFSQFLTPGRYLLGIGKIDVGKFVEALSREVNEPQDSHVDKKNRDCDNNVSPQLLVHRQKRRVHHWKPPVYWYTAEVALLGIDCLRFWQVAIHTRD